MKLALAACGFALALSAAGQEAAGQDAAGQDAPQQPVPGLRMPVVQACVSSPFGPRRAIGPHAPAMFHTGIDLPAPAGGGVFAVADGQVVGIHRRGVGGMEVILKHAGFTAIYAHLGNLTPALREGKRRIAAGEKIAVVGRTGITYGTHLFFEILVDGKPVDPAPILGVKSCR